MPEKITGIVMLGLAGIALLVFIMALLSRKDKRQEADREHRIEVKAQNDKFPLALFDKILEDSRLDVARLQEENESLKRKIKRLEDTAAKCKLNNLKEEA